jgi:cytoskeletal protein RodZ
MSENTKRSEEKHLKSKNMFKKHKGLFSWITFGVVILGIVGAIFIFTIPFPYTGIQGFTVKEPFTITEKYYEERPYTDKECHYEELVYSTDEKISSQCTQQQCTDRSWFFKQMFKLFMYCVVYRNYCTPIS